jgi:thymidylate kinase
MGITEVGAHPLRVTSKEAAIFKFKVSSEGIAPTFLLRKGMGNSEKSKQNCHRRGLWVVLLGPDGVGKSAVIARLASGLAMGFTGCGTYHLRPALFRRRREPVTNFDPHGQPARGTLISVFKLAYLLVANWLSYLMVVRPELARGQLVLFDRYFPDCLVDPRRYRLPQLCRSVAEVIARSAPRPDLYLVLDAPASVLQERKCEVTLSESARQRQGYAACLGMMRNAEAVDASRPLADVVAYVADLIIELRLARYREKYQIA